MNGKPASTRRRLLTALGSGTIVATSGCLANAHDALTRVSPPSTDPPRFRRWVPGPAVLPDGAPSVVRALDLETIRGFDANPERRVGVDLRNGPVRALREPIGVDDGNVDAAVAVDGVTVILGGFDLPGLRRGARRLGYERHGVRRGFAVFTRGNGRRAVAVSPEAVVFARGDRPVERAGAVVDAGRGVDSRLHEVDETFEELTDAAGAATRTRVYPDGSGPIDAKDAVGAATTTQVLTRRPRVFRSAYLLFESARDAERTRLHETFRTVANPPEPVDVDLTGRLAEAETWELTQDVARDPPTALMPVVALGFRPDADGNVVTIRHRGGREIPSKQLVVTADGRQTDRQFTDVGETVEPGDALTVEAQSGTTVRVQWTVEGFAETLDAYEVP